MHATKWVLKSSLLNCYNWRKVLTIDVLHTSYSNEVTRKIRELSQHMEEQFNAQRDLDAQLREKESHKLQEFRDKVWNHCSSAWLTSFWATWKVHIIVYLYLYMIWLTSFWATRYETIVYLYMTWLTSFWATRKETIYYL